MSEQFGWLWQCYIDGCTNPRHTNTLCKKHYDEFELGITKENPGITSKTIDEIIKMSKKGASPYTIHRELRIRLSVVTNVIKEVTNREKIEKRLTEGWSVKIISKEFGIRKNIVKNIKSEIDPVGSFKKKRYPQFDDDEIVYIQHLAKMRIRLSDQVKNGNFLAENDLKTVEWVLKVLEDLEDAE